MIGFGVLLAALGVVVDMLNIILEKTILGEPLGIIEDGGEMIVMSAITWYVFRFDLPGSGRDRERAMDSQRDVDRLVEDR